MALDDVMAVVEAQAVEVEEKVLGQMSRRLTQRSPRETSSRSPPSTPFGQRIPCNNEWFRTGHGDPPPPPNIDTIFIPSAMTTGSRYMLNFNQSKVKTVPGLYSSLLLLDLVC